MTGPPLEPVDLGPGVRGAFTRGWVRAGGSGAGFNLAVAFEDDAAAVEERFHALEEWIGAPVVRVRQVHGHAVHRCGAGTTAGAGAVSADALVTTDPACALAVLVADCVPVLLADPHAGVVAAIHAGRQGMVAGIVAATVAAMRDLGAVPGHSRAVIGPAICGACYEVPPALRDDVAAAVPGSASTTSWGTPALDLPAGVAAQLRSAGVGQVDRMAGCTLEDPRYFSHRGTAGGRPAGRFAGVVRRLG